MKKFLYTIFIMVGALMSFPALGQFLDYNVQGISVVRDPDNPPLLSQGENGLCTVRFQLDFSNCSLPFQARFNGEIISNGMTVNNATTTCSLCDSISSTTSGISLDISNPFLIVETVMDVTSDLGGGQVTLGNWDVSEIPGLAQCNTPTLPVVDFAGGNCQWVEPLPEAEAYINKSCAPGSLVGPNGGEAVTFTINVQNIGGSAGGSPATVTDSLSSDVTFVSTVEPAGWSCNHDGSPTGGLVTCNGPILPAGYNETITINATNNRTLTGTISNTANLNMNDRVIDDSCSINVIDPGSPIDLILEKSLSDGLGLLGSDTSGTTVPSINGQPPFNVSVTGDIDGVDNGGTYTYVLRIQNQDSNLPVVGDQVLVQDELETGMTFAGFIDTGVFNCAALPGTATNSIHPEAVSTNIRCTVDIEDDGQGGTTFDNTDTHFIIYQVQIDPAAVVGDEFDNWAWVRTPSEDNRDDNFSKHTSRVVALPTNIAVSKSAPASIIGGETFSYTIMVSNTSTEPALNVVLTDALPGNVIPLGAPAGCSLVGSDMTCNVGDMASGDMVDYIVSVTAGSAPDNISNTAVVTTSSAETDTSDNQSTANTVVADPQADLSVIKVGRCSPDPVLLNNQVTCSIEVNNAGPDTANNVVLADVAPAGLSLSEINPPAGWFCNLGQAQCLTLNMAVNMPATIDYVFTAVAEGPQLNSVSVSAATGDQNQSNNSDTDSVVVIVPADLAIAKSCSPDTILVGETSTCTLRVTNNGPSDEANAQVSDVLPAGLSLSSATPPAGWNCTGSDCTGPILNGESLDIILVVNGNAVGTHTNIATVTGTNDNNPVNDTATDDIAVIDRVADLGITKDCSPAAILVGDTTICTLSIINNGPQGEANAQVSDTLPVGLSLFSPVLPPAGWSCTNTDCSGPIGNGETIALNLQLQGDTAGTHTNIATVTGNSDNNPDNDSDTADVSVSDLMADLSIDKECLVTEMTQPGFYEVVCDFNVRNAGPSTAVTPSITDDYPDGWVVLSMPVQCSDDTDALVCPLGDLAADASGLITIEFEVPVGNHDNVVIVDSTTPDPDPDNNTDNEPVVVLDIEAIPVPTLREWGFLAFIPSIFIFTARHRKTHMTKGGD